MMDFEDLLKIHRIDIDEIEVVAFDVFDTLLYRNVSPNQVYKIWSNKVIEEFKIRIGTEDFLDKRKKAGWIQKVKNLLNGLDNETTYKQLMWELYNNTKMTVSFDVFYEKCIQIALDIEKEYCFKNLSICKYLDTARRKGKIVICISDYFLSSIQLNELLYSKGIFLDHVFSSCDYCRLKSTGNLYETVGLKLGISLDKILMIGDNKISDLKMAKKKRLHAIHIKDNKQFKKYKEMDNEEKNRKQEFQKMLFDYESTKNFSPFSRLAFPLFIFVERLYSQLVLDDCHDVLFMSREGEFLKRLFDLYQKQYGMGKKIQSHYLYVSRHSTLIPSIHEIKEESFKEIYKNYPSMKVEDFLKNLDLDDNTEIRNEFREYLKNNRIIEDFKESKEYADILSSKKFQEICLEKAKEQRRLFIKYLDDMNINYQADGLYIVDIGYSGTSQKNISKIFRNKIKVHGYYMICEAMSSNFTINNTICGILYDCNRKREGNILYTYNETVIESLLLASHSSVVGYKEEMKDRKIVPIFSNNDIEKNCYLELIKPIQKNIEEVFLNIILYVKKCFYSEFDYLTKFEKIYKRFIFNPEIKELELYIKIPITDNFAIYREERADNSNKIHRKFNIKNFLCVLKTKGLVLREQNTNWIAAAFYKMDLWKMNEWIYCFSFVAIRIFRFYTNAKMKRKISVDYRN